MTDIQCATPCPATFSIPPSPMRLIAEEVAVKHGVTLADMKARTRRQKIVHARQEAMWRMRQETPASYMKIALFFNIPDHAITIHSCKAYVRRAAG